MGKFNLFSKERKVEVLLPAAGTAIGGIVGGISGYQNNDNKNKKDAVVNAALGAGTLGIGSGGLGFLAGRNISNMNMRNSVRKTISNTDLKFYTPKSIKDLASEIINKYKQPQVMAPEYESYNVIKDLSKAKEMPKSWRDSLEDFDNIFKSMSSASDYLKSTKNNRSKLIDSNFSPEEVKKVIFKDHFDKQDKIVNNVISKLRDPSYLNDNIVQKGSNFKFTWDFNAGEARRDSFINDLYGNTWRKSQWYSGGRGYNAGGGSSRGYASSSNYTSFNDLLKNNGFTPTTTKKELVQQYRNRVKSMHPDLFPGQEVEKNKEMQKLNEIWDKIKKSSDFEKLAKLLITKNR